MDRRTFLAHLLWDPPVAGLSTHFVRAAVSAASAQQRDSASVGFLGIVPLHGPNPAPLGRLLGSGLDARLFTDLSTLTSNTLILPSERFFVRTARPEAAARDTDSWWIVVDGLVRSPLEIPIGTLRSWTRPMGEVLLECSGNSDPDNFGLIGAAAWEGAPLSVVLGRAEPRSEAARILVTGVDDPSSPMQTSYPGAAWIFTPEELSRAGAFLATGMNGAPLAPDHGAPVRLVVPGWYGCACIKWVNRITVVAEDAPATTQMREFSARTHQIGMPALARAYTPAVIDHAAMPIRVEQWSRTGRIVYRVVGIQWGGDQPIDQLLIRFQDEPFVPVDDCPMPASTATWSLWTHAWRPTKPGRYDIVLKAADPGVRTRRLDAFYYRRTVNITEV